MEIPPPYPFPEHWPTIAQQQQQSGCRHRWLTPYTPISHFSTSVHPKRFPPAAAAAAPTFPTWPSAGAPNTSGNDRFAGLYGGRGPSQELGGGASDHHSAVDKVEEEEDDEGDYEYGYQLRDEWRQYLKATVLSDDESCKSPSSSEALKRKHKSQRECSQQKPRGGKKTQQSSNRPPPSRPPTQLELVLDDARLLERERRGKRAAALADADSGHRKALQCVETLETALHARFEALCDAHSPTVWPQGAS